MSAMYGPLEKLDWELIRRRLSDVLARKNYYNLRGVDLVRVPQVKGIYYGGRGDEDSVGYIYKTWYDPKSKQMRNRKAKIGTLLDVYDQAMVPDPKNYTRFFDLETGELKQAVDAEPDPWDEEEARDVPEDQRPEAEEETDEETDETQEEEEQEEKAPAPEEEAGGEMREEEVNRKLLNVITDYTDKMLGPVKKTKAQEMDAAEARRQEEELELAYEEYERKKERIRVLKLIMEDNLYAIEALAKKQPDEIMNVYKVRKINRGLSEIREYYRDSKYADLLELIEEPREEEQDGVRKKTGMTYSDALVLLHSYDKVMSWGNV